jgi:methyl-accepting chemotaxis protein
MNRLRYTGKFALLGFIIMPVILVLLAMAYSTLRNDIDSAEQELAGLQMLKPLNRMIQLMQQHRGLSSGVLNGNTAMQGTRAAKEKEVDAVLVEVAAALSPDLREQPSWRRVNEDWEKIRREGLGWTPADNLGRHSEMIATAQMLIEDVAFATRLALDSKQDAYYLMDAVVARLPPMLELLGIARANGTGILSRKEVSWQQRIDLSSLISQTSGILRVQNNNLGKVMDLSPDLREALGGREGQIREFSNSVEKIITLIRDDILGERFSTAPQAYFTLATSTIDFGYKLMFEMLIPQFERQLEARKVAAQRMLAFGFGLSILILGLSGYLVIGAYYSVIASVDAFAHGARDLADGDLTARFHIEGKDELHTAGRAFDGMAAALRTMLGHIQGEMQPLRSAAEQLAASSQQISHSASAQSDAGSSVAAAVEQMTVGVDHISNSARDARDNARESDHAATEGGRIVGNVVDDIRDIAQTVNQVADSVETLGRQSATITTIVGVIREIAEQTNLLALNAAIEAARAGESGRGFAVVADEVRKLAERTAKSTEEIARTISSIQSGVEAAVGGMKHSVDRVTAGIQSAEQASAAMARIHERSQQVVQAIAEISGALGEQTTTCAEIAQNVERIAQMAEENNAAAGANADTAVKLRQLAENIGQEISRFRT